MKQGGCHNGSAFNYPLSICIDPIRPLNYYVGDRSSIRYVDTTSQIVSLVAGSSDQWCFDGIWAVARFNTVNGLACTSTGSRLYVCDSNNYKIRMVDTKTKQVTTVAGNGEQGMEDGVALKCGMAAPQKLTFDRSRKVKPDTVLFITTPLGIRRFDTATGKIITLYWNDRGSLLRSSPSGIVSTASGHLIVSCVETSAVYLLDPTALEGQPLVSPVSGYADGSGAVARFFSAIDLVVIDTERCAYLADWGNGRVRRMTLPPQLFRDDLNTPLPIRDTATKFE